MGQEISWREKPNISNPHALVPVCEVYLTVLVPACTRVKDYGRVPCPKSLAAAGRK